MADQKVHSRRSFVGTSLAAGLASVFGMSGLQSCSNKTGSGEKELVLTADGKLVAVDSSAMEEVSKEPAVGDEARKGIPGRKFVMVIDLGACSNAGACTRGCQKGHDLASHQEWMKVKLMKDSKATDPYWMPKPCYHCDNPPCVKVCPVDATYKRSDGIVLVDNERCIGCKFCISACPYSARIFNWQELPEHKRHPDVEYSPETSVPADVGTIGKCDFCPDRSRLGLLPYCASSCPNGAIYYGDENEDTVTNGTVTVRFTKLLADRYGYRQHEELGTGPRVYYLPPTERMFPYEVGMEKVSEEKREVLENYLSSKNGSS